MTTATLPWFETLWDSVHALGVAARDARRAHRQAEILAEQWTLDRVRPVDGMCVRPGLVHEQTRFRPHDQVVMRIGRANHEYQDATARIFQVAAVAYANGGLWAITQVLAGEKPDAVHGERTGDGLFTVPFALPRPAVHNALERWSGFDAYRAAERALNASFVAEGIAEDIAAADYVSDHEAGQMWEALNESRHLPEAACDFGARAEEGLSFALLDHRAARTARPAT